MLPNYENRSTGSKQSSVQYRSSFPLCGTQRSIAKWQSRQCSIAQTDSPERSATLTISCRVPGISRAFSSLPQAFPPTVSTISRRSSSLEPYAMWLSVITGPLRTRTSNPSPKIVSKMRNEQVPEIENHRHLHRKQKLESMNTAPEFHPLYCESNQIDTQDPDSLDFNIPTDFSNSGKISSFV